MSSSKAQKQLRILSFFFCIALVISTVQATSHVVSGGVGAYEHKKRFIRKRAPQDQDLDIPIPVVGAGDGPPTLSSSSIVSSTSASASSSSASSSASSSSSVSSVSQSSSSQSVSSSASSSVSSSASTASSASQASVTTSAPVTSEQVNAIGATQETAAPSKSTLTKTATAGTAEETQPQTQTGLSSTSKTAIFTVLGVVAASVAGVAILWTIFRKWKLGRSSQFDARMQPIDWQPTTHDDGPIAGHRRHSNASSFHSGLGHGSAGRGYGATSDLGHDSSDHGHERLGPLPDHDFTAGAAHLAPVGGYADLARGPSPQPQMTESLSRGASINRPAYGNGVPLHHQTGYDSYDHNPRY